MGPKQKRLIAKQRNLIVKDHFFGELLDPDNPAVQRIRWPI